MNATERALAVVVLAAGQGTRMKSQRPKVLHDVAGRPLRAYPLGAAEALAPARLLVVVSQDSGEVQAAFRERAEFVVQPEPRGTGEAVQRALPLLEDFRGDVLILYGDTPLLRRETLQALREKKRQTGCDLIMLTSPSPLPGRVVRDPSGRVERVVEVTDATPEELEIQEGNTGVYLVDAEFLGKALAQLDDDNAQGELYVTDIVGYAVSQQRRVEALTLDDPDESLGVNTRAELAQAAAAVRRRILERLMADGVTLVDPDHTYVDVDVEVGRDTVIEPGCVLRGATRIGERVTIKPHCVIESSVLEDDVTIGPSAHLRPGSRLGRGARVGNFVEVKNSTLGAGVKADHLAYIGDADVGDGASFGCGAITVNYDWDAKHRTQVGEGVSVGCNANLVAPVSLAKNSAVAAGSTVTRDVPPDALAVARDRQRNVEGWRKRRSRKKKGSG
jgi:bifunctional UDP-N-acetylglucosamine pyrophosphorylase/glucosamine-1-phosphate N-acetyltransferase